MFEIGINLRVTECLDKGERNYMEDFSRCFFERVDDNIAFGFFGVFDGHGGKEAASFVKKNLVKEICAQDKFLSHNDEDVLDAIKQGFLKSHNSMWNERDKWPKTLSGYKSTSGTTASIMIIRNRKLYVGHVGDSGIILGHSNQEDTRTDYWRATRLTVEHKPENPEERERIESLGGSLMRKAGIERVVWNRPKAGEVHSARRSTEYEQIPFLAVARSLGDFWSYDHDTEEFHVSPEPDVLCIDLDTTEHRCIVLGSDGLWNVVNPEAAVEIVRVCERETERRVFLDPNINTTFFYNPAASLVKFARSAWRSKHTRADNITALVVMIDPPGQSMTKLRLDRRQANLSCLNIIPGASNSDGFTGLSFLVESGKWKSANRPDTELSEGVRTLQQPPTPIINDDTEPDTVPDAHTDSALRDERDEKVAPGETLNVLISEAAKANGQPECRVLSKRKPSRNEKENHAMDRGRLIDKARKFLLNHEDFKKSTMLWRNNLEVWDAVALYFCRSGCYMEAAMNKHLCSFGLSIACQRLALMPWVVACKRLFKHDTMLGPVVDRIPLFDDIWQAFYDRHIFPIIGAATYSKKRLEDILVLNHDKLKKMLKSSGYIKLEHAVAKKRLGNDTETGPSAKRAHLSGDVEEKDDEPLSSEVATDANVPLVNPRLSFTIPRLVEPVDMGVEKYIYDRINVFWSNPSLEQTTGKSQESDDTKADAPAVIPLSRIKQEDETVTKATTSSLKPSTDAVVTPRDARKRSAKKTPADSPPKTDSSTGPKKYALKKSRDKDNESTTKGLANGKPAQPELRPLLSNSYTNEEIRHLYKRTSGDSVEDLVNSYMRTVTMIPLIENNKESTVAKEDIADGNSHSGDVTSSSKVTKKSQAHEEKADTLTPLILSPSTPRSSHKRVLIPGSTPLSSRRRGALTGSSPPRKDKPKTKDQPKPSAQSTSRKSRKTIPSISSNRSSSDTRHSSRSTGSKKASFIKRTLLRSAPARMKLRRLVDGVKAKPHEDHSDDEVIVSQRISLSPARKNEPQKEGKKLVKVSFHSDDETSPIPSNVRSPEVPAVSSNVVKNFTKTYLSRTRVAGKNLLKSKRNTRSISESKTLRSRSTKS